ncbi:MAG TPA: class I SAM-dependent methyltransferase [Mycobacteriales bacterium]|nr:class I SAM-dependent methyltransferase [Mycobacteriales bacterium]
MADRWVAGDLYEPYVGRWSRKVAPEFLRWLGAPPGRRWLDVGCGTGALTQTILDLAEPSYVVGVEPSAGFVEHARAHVVDPRAEFSAGDALSLGRADAEFDAVVSGLVLNFVPDQPAALAEMRRVAKPGATVAAYVWDYAEGMQLMRVFWDAAVSLDPTAAAEADEASRFSMCRPEALAELFTAAGYDDVATDGIVVPTVFRDFDDYWTPFLSGQAPAPGYTMSLAEDARAELRELIRSRLPYDADGSIPLTARAWAVKGIAQP